MRINLVLPPVGLSGGIRVLAIYAEALQQRGHQVFVVSPAIARPSLPRALVRWAKGQGWRRLPKRLPSHFDNCNVEHRVLETFRPVVDADLPDADVVVATWWETAPWVAALAPSKGTKVYFVQDYGALGQPLDKLIETWRLPMRLVTISGFLRDLVREHVSVDAEVVPNGVNLDHFASPPREKNSRFRVGMLYRSMPEKGCDNAVAAVERARARLPELAFTGFGDSLPSRLSPVLSEFRWQVPDGELPKIYASCDAWLFPSKREGYGLPILEAMASRTPVIATPAGAARELIEGGGGILVPHEDVEAMADAIVSLAAMSADRWRAMSDAAYQTAERHTWEHAVDCFENALVNAVSEGGRSAPAR